MTTKLSSLLFLFILLITFGCADHEIDLLPEPTKFTASDFASGLRAPIGISADDKGRLWVTEAGTGNNDASISLITKDGTVYPVISDFPSVITDGVAEGIGHLAYKDGKLYILSGLAGRLYIADVSSFKPGDPTTAASSLHSEDIATFIRSLNLNDPIHTNIYNLTFGPDGDLYIADAAANAIFKRDKGSQELSLFARIPNVTPTAESVPTGIVFDGKRFLVSSFTGFPFAGGSAKIFQVSLQGTVSDYKSDFTALTDIVLTPNNKLLVTEFAEFSFTTTPPGFGPVSGRVANENGDTLIEGLSLPTAIERSGLKTYYVLSYGQGTVQKLTAD